jgi:CheY-like chemotaxis protein
MSLSTVIVDDEQLARDELAYLLKSVDDVQVVATGKNGLEAVTLIREHTPDLVFLDVEMPGLDGFGVIKKLLDKKFPMPQIVFATAYDQYAVKAFEVNAVDYVLKPFDKKRIAQSVQKARRNLQSDAGPNERIDSLVKMLEAQQSKANKIVRHRRRHGRPVELPNSGRIAGLARRQALLACPPLLSGQREPHQGSGALVQELLPAPYGRQEAERGPRQPRPNQASERIVWVVKSASEAEALFALSSSLKAKARAKL